MITSGNGARSSPQPTEENKRIAVEAQLARCRRVTVPVAALGLADRVRVNGEDNAHVRMLAEVRDELPAIVVHKSTMRVIDGMHRLRAAALRGDTRIDVLLYEGSDADAFVLAVRLNATHGLPLSKADRNAAARRIIRSHPTWSDRAVATVTGLSPKTVAAQRRSVPGGEPALARVGKDGRVRALNLADARRYAGRLFTESPEASLREVARKAGISVGTARDVRQRLRAGGDPVPLKQRRTQQQAVTAQENATGQAVTAQPVTAQPQPEHDTRTASQWRAVDLDPLKRDPSLRFTEAGRTIIRLLEIGALSREQLQRYAGMVPLHCAGVVAQAARRCAKAWEEFARKLEEKKLEDGLPVTREVL